MRHGFSLIELSIVLVILGLLTGGILAGRSLIRASELRAVITEYQKYAVAGRAFRDKYFSLPGDMNNATAFWGTATGAAACPGNNPAAARPDAKTCNGDGDGNIVHVSAGGGNQNEVFGAWQHLANAGLIEGQYAGVNNTVGCGVPYCGGTLGGFNVPKSKLSNGTWGVFTLGIVPISSPTQIDGDYGTALFFGVDGNALWPRDPYPLSTEEAWNIDTKLDDGKPGTGRIVTFEGTYYCYRNADNSIGDSSTTVTKTDIIYNLAGYAGHNGTCPLIFKQVW
jgi:prepilin-type N-terminal cleavage/methylation domain-containing protein